MKERALRAGVFSAVVAGAVLATAGAARAQDLGQIHQQFTAAHLAGQVAEAERLARQGVEVAQARGDEFGVATFSSLLGMMLVQQEKNKEAEAVTKRATELWERRAGPNDKRVANALCLLGIAIYGQGRYAEAEQVFRRSLEIEEKLPRADRVPASTHYRLISETLVHQDKFDEAETYSRRGIAVAERHGGPNDPKLVSSLTQLADLLKSRDRFAEAEALFKRALAIAENDPDPNPGEYDMLPPIAPVLGNLSSLYFDMGRYSEAETLLRRTRAIVLKAKGPDDPSMAAIHNKFGAMAMRKGRYAEAESEYKAELAVVEKVWGVDHPKMAMPLESLARVDWEQGRHAAAEARLRRALYLREKYEGADSLQTAFTILQLADVYRELGRHQESERLIRRALALLEKAFGPDHTRVCAALYSLGCALQDQNRLDEAEAVYLRALAADDRNGHINPLSAPIYQMALANVRIRRGHWDDALTLLDSAIAGFERVGTPPQYRTFLLERRAFALWRQGKTAEALADVRLAIALCEQQNADYSGAERERAASSGDAGSAFELMVSMQTDLGPDRCDVAAVFDATERAHARTLLDEMNLAGTDLDAGMPAADRARLRAREGALKTEVRQLEVKLGRLKGPDDPRAAVLAKDLARARNALYAHDRDVRNDSPVYRSLLSRRGTLPTLDEIQKTLLRPGDLMLVYYFGDVVGVTLAVTHDSARAWKAAFANGEAKTLGVDAGSMNAGRLRRALLNAGRTGVAQRLADPKGEVPVEGLAALADALIPADVRKGITDGTFKRLIVVPDGPLALLPFEALVMERGVEPKYLLDVGPPVVYAPSAAVLKRLTERAAKAPAGDRASVLALGDPAYPTGDGSAPADEARGPIGERARYALAGGKLPRLPYSGWEAQWVVKAFNDAGVTSLALTGAAATEGGVRARAPGRKVLHLACHGMVDQELGNFYGGLALATGPRADDTADDGFLRLNEIHALDLSRCELAILSACETNFGPRQKGEGTWSLSRGFLVAGARRVVASNWLVDDEAAASLVSVYSTLLAQSEKTGAAADYAAALRDAKRWVRAQEKWKAPYFWATLVLVGPH